ncbi:MAG: rhomboid family intramembrane serine protease [Candidatus Odinarchaeia archaeon]
MYTTQYQAQPPTRQKFPYITAGLIIVNVVIWIASNINYPYVYNYLLSNFALYPIDIVSGQNLYTLITSMFLHASIYEPFGFIHIFFNMYALFLFGTFIERKTNPFIYIGLYFFSGVISGIFHSYMSFVLSPSMVAVPTIGASGAIFGVLAAFAVFFPKQTLYFFGIPLPAWILILGFLGLETIFALLPSGAFMTIANTAHIGGFIGGAIFSLIYRIITNKLINRKKKKDDDIPVIYL